MFSSTILSKMHPSNALLLTKVLGAAITYGFVAILARTLDPTSFGMISIILVSAGYGVVLCGFGQHMILVRDIAAAASKDNAISVAKQGAALNLCGLAVGVAAFVVGAIGLNFIGFAQSVNVPMVFGFAALLISIAAAEFVTHMARGLHAHILAISPKEILWRPLSLVCVWVLFGTSIQASQLAFVMAFVLFALTIIQLSLVARQLERTHFRPNIDDGPNHASKTSFWIGAISNQFLGMADVILVGAILGAELAGGYFVASRIVQILGFFVVAQNQTIAPLIAKQAADQSYGSVASISQTSARAMSGPIILLGLGLALFAEPAMTLFNAEFAAHIWVLRLLILGMCLNAIFGPADIILNMSGFENRAMRVAIWSVAISFVCIALGALLLGLNGAAIGFVLATTFRKWAYWRAVHRILQIRSDALVFGRTKPSAPARRPVVT